MTYAIATLFAVALFASTLSLTDSYIRGRTGRRDILKRMN